MRNFKINGLFPTEEFDLISEARNALQSEFNKQVLAEQFMFEVQCRTHTSPRAYVSVSVSPDIEQSPSADKYAAFNSYTGMYSVFNSFSEARDVVIAKRKERIDALKASYSISTLNENAQWVVLETLWGTNE